MKKKSLNIFVLNVLILISASISAQKTQTYTYPERAMNEAGELFAMQQYGAAKDAFIKIYSSASEAYSVLKEDALYYASLSACLLYHKDAERLCRNFIKDYRESIHLNDVYMHLANYKFNNGAYSSALACYEEVEENILDGDKQIEYLFKKAYCYFLKNKYDEAKPMLAKVKSTESQYQNKALFYYSHIQYIEKNYRSALAGFNQLKDLDSYSAIVPFYIAQIQFMLGDYEAVIAQADMLIEKSTEKRIPEINHIIAQSYYLQEKYKEALPYMENYFSKIEMATGEDYYVLGYCYYQEGEYEKAIKSLTKAISRNNEALNQQTYFLIGDCYMKTGQKEFAANTFYAAYEIKEDPYITEDALYTYAKLQYELSKNPFSNAITAFEKYMNEYPKAARRAEAENFLSNIYLTTKNYNAAIKSLGKIEHRSAVLNEAYQRVLCFKGMELYNSGKYDMAREYFEKSMDQNYNGEVYSQTLFWEAESYYQQGDYEKAVTYYNRFFAAQTSGKTKDYNMALYNSGYSHFKMRQYSHALSKFLDFEKTPEAEADTRLKSDVCNRIGDCFFMLSKMKDALVYYDKTLSINSYDEDYAMYQKAEVLGNMSRNNEKIEIMNQLQQKYPSSEYTAEALLEVADTYMELGNYEKASDSYIKYVKKYPNNQNTKGVMLKLGMVYFNTEDDQNALKIFKRIVQDYPKTKEASTALKNIENIYSISGNVEEFFAYVRDVSFANITVEAQDTITFNSASDKYYGKQFLEAEKAFDSYIEKFPQGIFITHAHYYRADCRMRRSHYNEALSDYEYVIEHPLEQFEITSLINAAEINYRNGNYRSTIVYYQRLQSKDLLPSNKQSVCLGLMRANFADSNFNGAIAAADVLAVMDKLPSEMLEETHAVKARSAVFLKNWDMAEREYTWLSKNSQSEYGSEALYMLADIEYLQGNLDLAEKKVFEIIVNINYEYWSVKSYILLGDIYADKGNTFQAKHTYLSIIDNYDGEELRTLAINKYNALLAKEETEAKSLE